jgi:hypothetical protein
MQIVLALTPIDPIIGITPALAPWLCYVVKIPFCASLFVLLTLFLVFGLSDPISYDGLLMIG